MGAIDDFVSEYERQFDSGMRRRAWLVACWSPRSRARDCAPIVTSRAKSVDRLADKLHARSRKKPYTSTAQIRRDIADLAGVRVALYFPGQMDEAERVIRATLDVQRDKRFPLDGASVGSGVGTPETVTATGEQPPSSGTSVHRQRFSGYGARHFRASFPTRV